MRRNINLLIICLLMAGLALSTTANSRRQIKIINRKSQGQTRRQACAQKEAKKKRRRHHGRNPRQALALLDQLFDETKDLKDGVTRTECRPVSPMRYGFYDEARAV